MLSHLQAGIEITAGTVPSAACGNTPQANQHPTVEAARTPTGDVTTGTAIAFTATGTDPDGDPLTYAWEFGDGGTSSARTPRTPTPRPGTYAAKVTVSDGRGGSGTATLNVVVTQANRDPSVVAARTPTGDVTTGTAIAFTATGTDPDGDPLTYAWDFGDSTTSSAQNPSHAYLAAGSYTARVTVSDGRGGTASDTVGITVTGPTCVAGYRDDFNGTALGAGWSVVRGDAALTVGGGLLTIPTQTGDLYQTTNTAKNIVLRPAPTGTVHDHGQGQPQGPGAVPAGRDHRLRHRRQLRQARPHGVQHADRGQHRVLRVHPGGQRHRAQRQAQDRTANLAATFPQDFYVRIVWNGTNLTGQYSTDGHDVDAGRPASTAMPANARVGVHALSNAAATAGHPDVRLVHGRRARTCRRRAPTATR